MSTRLVERLEREIAQCEDPFERECLKAQYAAVIARLGQLDHAKFILSGLKTQARRHGQSRLWAWVHFVDANICYFTEVNSEAALKKFKDARGAAIDANDAHIHALASAWAGANEYQLRRDDDLVSSLREAFSLADSESHDVLSRAWLVLADAADTAGWYENSLQWYERARVHAASYGDSIMTYIIMRNRANSLSAHQVRQELFGVAAITSAQRALGEAESTHNFDQALRNSALVSAAPLIHAEVLVVLGRWEEALGLINRYFEAMKAHGGNRLAARQLASRAWCYANLGRQADAVTAGEAAAVSLELVLDPDDRAVSHKRLALTHQLLGASDLAGQHFSASSIAFDEFLADQTKLAARLQTLRDVVPNILHPWPQD